MSIPYGQGHSSSELRSERAALLRDAILDSLSLPTLHDREAQIVKSHSSTFHWIWQTHHSFHTFLTTPKERAYWITGLPGSGKSTLLRHIGTSNHLSQLLKKWGGNKPITIASFYFWESGTIMQRSQEGLLRSLLHQLLESHPEMIPSVFRTLWSDIWSSSTLERVRKLSSWSIQDLSAGFNRFWEEAEKLGSLICLLIDGLDEFEGEHAVTIGMLNRVAGYSNVKICVSSRPWEVFDIAFKDVPQLKLQDLTNGDMKNFVRENLGHRAMEEDYEDLIERIVNKAKGVFLWLSLVTASLVEFPRPGVAPGELERRLEQLPSGLDALYQYRLIDTAIAANKTKMSEIVKLMRAREEVCNFIRDEDAALVSVWEMVLATRFRPLDVVTMDIQQAQGVPEYCRALGDDLKVMDGLVQLQSCGSSTLVQKDDTDSRVVYVHRTVKDWLAGPIRSRINTFSTLSPHLGLLQASLLHWKYPLVRPKRARAVAAWWPQIVLAFTHARLNAPTLESYDLLVDLNETLNWYYPRMGAPVSADSWARSCFGTLEQRGKTAYEDAFLALAVKFGLAHFVRKYIRAGKYERGNGRSILEWATMYLFDRQSSIYPLSNPEIVATLLQHGIDPNYRLILPQKRTIDTEGQSTRKAVEPLHSPWEATLECKQQAMRRGWVRNNEEERKGYTTILRLFLEHGADRQVQIQASHKDTKEHPQDLLRRLRDMCPSEEMDAVSAMI